MVVLALLRCEGSSFFKPGKSSRECQSRFTNKKPKPDNDEYQYQWISRNCNLFSIRRIPVSRRHLYGCWLLLDKELIKIPNIPKGSLLYSEKCSSKTKPLGNIYSLHYCVVCPALQAESTSLLLRILLYDKYTHWWTIVI